MNVNVQLHELEAQRADCIAKIVAYAKTLEAVNTLIINLTQYGPSQSGGQGAASIPIAPEGHPLNPNAGQAGQNQVAPLSYSASPAAGPPTHFGPGGKPSPILGPDGQPIQSPAGGQPAAPRKAEPITAGRKDKSDGSVQTEFIPGNET